MTVFRDDQLELVADGLRTVLFEKYKSYPKEYKQVFNIYSSKKMEEKDSAVSGFGLMPEKQEGEPVAYDDPIRGFNISYRHVTYGLGFRVTREMWEDDLYNVIKKLPTALARSARHTVEQESANIFNFGFSDQHILGGDGKPLFAGDHPLTGGGIYSNRLAIPADLSVSSLQEALQLMEETVDDRGLNLAIKPKLLVVPPALKWTARELLKSQGRPGTADNDYNALLDDELSYFVWHYLTDNDAWFLLSSKDDHELNFFWRRKLDSEHEEDFDTGDLKFKATMRFSVKYSDWRGVVGCPGGGGQ